MKRDREVGKSEGGGSGKREGLRKREKGGNGIRERGVRKWGVRKRGREGNEEKKGGGGGAGQE